MNRHSKKNLRKKESTIRQPLRNIATKDLLPLQHIYPLQYVISIIK